MKCVHVSMIAYFLGAVLLSLGQAKPVLVADADDQSVLRSIELSLQQLEQVEVHSLAEEGVETKAQEEEEGVNEATKEQGESGDNEIARIQVEGALEEGDDSKLQEGNHKAKVVEEKIAEELEKKEEDGGKVTITKDAEGAQDEAVVENAEKEDDKELIIAQDEGEGENEGVEDEEIAEGEGIAEEGVVMEEDKAMLSHEQVDGTIQKEIDSLLTQFVGDEVNNMATQMLSSTAASHPNTVLVEEFSESILKQLTDSEELKDFTLMKFSTSQNFQKALLNEFLDSKKLRDSVLQEFSRLQSNKEQMSTSQSVGAVLRKFVSSAEFEETLMQEFNKDREFAVAILQEWAENQEFRNVMVQEFSSSARLKDRASALLAESKTFANGVARRFVTSSQFQEVLIQHYDTTDEILDFFISLYETAPELKAKMLKLFTKDKEFRKSVLKILSDSSFTVSGNASFKALFLERLVKSERFQNAVFEEFSLSPQFQDATIALLSSIQQFKIALVKQFASSDELEEQIGTSAPIMEAALQKFTNTKSFRNAVMKDLNSSK